MGGCRSQSCRGCLCALLRARGSRLVAHLRITAHFDRHHLQAHLLAMSLSLHLGRHHEISLICCACQTVAESLLLHGLWPATPVEPTLAFTVEVMHLALALMMECQVSLYDLCKALEFFKNPLLKVEYCMLCFLLLSCMFLSL